jgi:Predicted membrane protein (DUF2231)
MRWPLLPTAAYEREESEMSRLLVLIRGFSGHPLHPPLTDVVIGAYTVGVAMLVAGALGFQEEQMAHGALLAVAGGLIVTVPTAVSGLVDWLAIAKADQASEAPLPGRWVHSSKDLSRLGPPPRHPPRDDAARELKERAVVAGLLAPPDEQAQDAIEPCVGALDHPASRSPVGFASLTRKLLPARAHVRR